MIKNILVLLLLTLFLNACFSSAKTSQTMSQWLGENKHKLLMNFGPPDKVSEDGNGGEILVYLKSSSAPFATNNISLTNTQELKMYFVNPEGIIYHYLLKYKEITPTQVDVNLVRTP